MSRNIDLIDAVIHLREIAILVEEECGNIALANAIRLSAEQLHQISIAERMYAVKTAAIIEQAKE